MDITGVPSLMLSANKKAMPFIISWKLGAKKVFHITRDEWIHGMKALQYLLLSNYSNKEGRYIS